MATLEQLLADARAQADSYLGQQKAVAQTDYDAQVNALRKALEQSQTEANLQQGNVTRDYENQVAQINQQVYNDSQARQLMGYAGGMQNSQQFLAQIAGDQYRRQQLDAGVAKDRDARLHEIATRLNSLKTQTEFDLASALSGFNNRVAGLTSEAENMYNQRVMSLREQQLQQQYALEQMQREYELSMAQARALGGYGSPGGGTRSTTSNTTGTLSNLNKAVNNYSQATNSSALQKYYNSQVSGVSPVKQQQALNTMAKYGLLKTPAQDKNLTDLQRVNMMTNKSPKLTATAKKTSTTSAKKVTSTGAKQMR